MIFMARNPHLEQFELTTPDFLPVLDNGPVLSFLASDPGLLSCVACTDPPVPTLHFLRSATSDLVQFRDTDGILRPYFFPVNALSSPGTYQTLPGINVAVGTLVVSQTPEPSTLWMAIAGGLLLVFGMRKPKRSLERVTGIEPV